MDRTPFRDTSCARTRVRAGVHVRRLLACTAVLASALAISTGGTQAASSNVTVTLDVLSSTTLDAAACPTAARSFGTVLPDSSVVASAPCAITFGSSNNTSMLKMYQQDLFGDAMFARTDGTTMDTAFAAGGMRMVTFPEGNSNGKWGVLQPDGKYIIGGDVLNGGDTDSGLFRIGITGTLDPLFGDGGTGRKVHDFAPTYGETTQDAILEPGGKIVAAGYRADVGLNFDNAMLVRYTDTGQFDPTFGGGDGMVDAESGGWDQWWGVVALPDGKYFTVGCSCGIGTGDALLGRYNSDGTPDTSFSPNGVVERTWGTTMSRLQTVIPLASGKFIVGGSRNNGGGERAFVARLNADLSLDTGYGVLGFRDFPTFTGISRISLAAPDGSVWVAGHVDNSGGGTGYDVAIARLAPGGGFDTTWNSTGMAQATYAGASNDMGYGTLPMGPDSVLVVGGTNGGTGDGHAVAFTNGGTAGVDTSFSGDGKQLLDISGAFDYVVEAFWGREGRIVTVGSAGGNMGVGIFAGGGTVPDYGGGAVFGSADTQAAFGACLEARSGVGVAGGWTVDPGGSCTAVVGDPWTGIADDSSAPTAKVLGSPTSGVINATATIRFGVKTALAQTPRSYSAPIAIEVIAPNA